MLPERHYARSATEARAAHAPALATPRAAPARAPPAIPVSQRSSGVVSLPSANCFHLYLCRVCE